MGVALQNIRNERTLKKELISRFYEKQIGAIRDPERSICNHVIMHRDPTFDKYTIFFIFRKNI